MKEWSSIKKAIQKPLSALLALALVLPCCGLTAAAAPGEQIWLDGSYQGTGAGYNGQIVLSVTVENGRIAQVSELSQQETPERWERASALLSAIAEANSPEIDAISGATYSSRGICAAVEEALAKASTLPAGSGTERDPYRIYNGAQLREFGAWVDAGVESAAGGLVVLQEDVDLSGAPWNPIGAEGRAADCAGKLFNGAFSGGGHTVSGLALSGVYSAETNLGLFSTLGPDARISDLILSEVSVTAVGTGEPAAIRAGGLAGDTAARDDRTRAAIVDGCRVSGAVRVQSPDGRTFAGGLLGRGFTGCAVVNSVSTAEVTAVSGGGNNAACAGGIAGMLGNGTALVNCAAFGPVTAENLSGGADAYAGGMTGLLAGTVYACYAAAPVSVVQHSGAEKCFAGCLTGQLAASPAGTDNSYRSDAALTVLDESGAAETLPARPWSPDDRTGNAAAEPETGDPVTVRNSSLTAVTGALNEPALRLREWVWEDGRPVPTGPIWSHAEIDGSIFASGTGTAEDPWLLRTPEQLRAFGNSLSGQLDYRGRYLRLEADLDLSGQPWSPIGGSYARFDGSFDGGGHTISGLTFGSADAPMNLDADSACVGLFGWLNQHAVVHNLRLDRVSIHTVSPGSAYIGAIAGRMSGTDVEGDYRGAVIDHCFVSGEITHVTEKGTSFLGGVCGHMFKGAVINTQAQLTLDGREQSGELAEVGGIAGLANRGLIANCAVFGSLTGSGYRETERDIEGMACVGGIAGVNGGTIVNCCAGADVEALEYSIDAGLVAGWVTGIAKAYRCYYSAGASMRIDGREVRPPDPFGELVPGGVSDEYFFRFPGSLTDGIFSYVPDRSGAEEAVSGLNAAFGAFPVDLTGLYGLPANCLRLWESVENRPALSDSFGTAVYVQPAVEKRPAETAEAVMEDGVWYGRSQDKSCIVALTVSGGAVTGTRLLSGSDSGPAYTEAVSRARNKAVFGDDSDYTPAQLSRFPRGAGTAPDPYRVETEAQLRYLAESVNEDVDWAGVYFLQTADITLSGDWDPIGWGIFADADGDGFGQDIVALYPFRGSYDGGGHVISGLTVGSAQAPAAGNWCGLFGVIQGGYTDNSLPDAGAPRAELKNIRLEDVGIFTENRWRSVAGGLVGSAQGGFLFDGCTVSGTVSARSTEDFAYSGGLSGSLMYGCVSDCGTDTEVFSWSDLNYSYAGGMSAVTNRATLVNSFALGDVHGAAALTNRAEAGGFTGLDGGLCVNCYAYGSVEVLDKYSMYLGGFAGMAASSAEHRQCYYNADAAQRVAGVSAEEKRFAGKLVNQSTEAADQARAAADMASESFAALLEQNRRRRRRGQGPGRHLSRLCGRSLQAGRRAPGDGRNHKDHSHRTGTGKNHLRKGGLRR